MQPYSLPARGHALRGAGPAVGEGAPRGTGAIEQHLNDNGFRPENTRIQ